MRYVIIALLITCFSICGVAQDKPYRILPDAAEVARISFIDPSPAYYSAETLLSVLRQLVLCPDKTRDPRAKYQSGTFELKDGTSIYWFAGDDKSLHLLTGTEMKYFAIPTAAEIDEFLTLPKADTVEQISIWPSAGNWYTEDSLLKALPNFVAGGGYKPKMQWQQGQIKLKNGRVLNWKAYSSNTLVLHFRHGEKYFVLNKPDEHSQ